MSSYALNHDILLNLLVTILSILQCKGDTQSLLLWLSIVRKVFTSAEMPIPISLLQRDAESSAAKDRSLKPLQDSLLQEAAFIPILVSD